MQHDNNIENKLREIEAMEQPDVSQMDNHWQQMASMLQPSVLPVKKGWPKWMLNSFYAAAVMILISVAVWYAASKKNDEVQNVVTQNVNTAKSSSNNTVGDIAIAGATGNTDTTNATAILNKLIIGPSPVKDKASLKPAFMKPPTTSDSLLANIKLNYIPCDGCADKKDDAIITDTKQLTKLQMLFAQLGKQEQHFIINNTRDTVLKLAEGTMLLIPANSFDDINGVELTATEFYKTSDIILNQLHTTSNKEQLETGGMLYLQASYKGKEINISKDKPIALFMPDTSSRMNNMQLFYKQNPNANTGAAMGDTASAGNRNPTWVAQPFRFTRLNTVAMTYVLNLVNMPYDTKTKRGKSIAYFLIDENLQVPKDKLKKLLQERYGYDKIKIRNAEWWEVHSRNLNWTETGASYFNSYYATKIGDSVWMEKSIADRYKLIGTAAKTETVNNDFISLKHRGYQTQPNYFEQTFNKLSSQTAQELKERYSVSLDRLGWINCDRFYADSRKKVNCTVDLGDSASNYYTMLVFDNINSMMTGYVSDNKVMFQNIPIGEPVKIISIGINQNGETVYSVTHTTTSEQELKGLQFQTTSVPDLKAALSKLDK